MIKICKNKNKTNSTNILKHKVKYDDKNGGYNLLKT